VVIKGPQGVSSLGMPGNLRPHLYKCPCINEALPAPNGEREAHGRREEFVLRVQQTWVPLSSVI
jgi:hypothetical protein